MNKKKDLLISRSLPDNFETQVRQTPRIPALKVGEAQWTYEQLNKEANRHAHAILSLLGEGNETIVMLLEQGAQPIIALLGILKAGKIYVALEPDLTLSYLARVVAEADSRLIVTNNRNLALAKDLASAEQQVLNIDLLLPDGPEQNPGIAISPDTPATIFYTSGSTGQPKGLVYPHGKLAWSEMSSERIGPGDRCSLMFSSSFAGSRGSIFITLLSGATLLPFNLRTGGLPSLARWIEAEQITYFQPPLGLFREFLESLPEGKRIPSVRYVVFGGTSLYGRDIARFWEHFSPECVVINALALSETGVITLYTIRQEEQIPDGIVPVGYPIEGIEIWLEDEKGNRISKGKTGEICVQSDRMASEFWRDDKLSTDKFEPAKGKTRIYRTGDLGRIDAKGRLIHLGRKDFMVKIRGYRIEILEVQAALLAIEGVKDAAVVAQGNVDQEKYLAAYVVPADGIAFDAALLRKRLQEKLALYKVPSTFMYLDALPVTPNGKLDRNALPTPDHSRPELEQPYIAPRTEAESQLAAIWAECLNLTSVGVHDDFFELGGDSLIAAQIISRVYQAFRVEIPLQSLLDSSDVAGMARRISADSLHTISDDELEQVLSEIESLSHEAVLETLNPGGRIK